MSYYILVYNMADGSPVPDGYEVYLPDTIDEEDIEEYIDVHYPEVGEYQVEVN
jgi:hypothetical protein